jgi:hypothetical protein
VVFWSVPPPPPAAELFRRRQLRRAQYPMLAAMVAFTAGGIALVTAS